MITPGIPVGFTAIFIMFSTLRQELSEMLQVVVNNQLFFTVYGWNWRGCRCRSQKDKIFLSLAAPAAKRRARGSGRILGACARVRLRSASAPPAKPLAVCRFPHVSHWKWTRHSRLPRPMWKGLKGPWEGSHVKGPSALNLLAFGALNHLNCPADGAASSCSARSQDHSVHVLENNLFAVYLGNSSRSFAWFQSSCSNQPTKPPPPPHPQKKKKKKKLGSTRITWVVPQRLENTEIRKNHIPDIDIYIYIYIIYIKNSDVWLSILSSLYSGKEVMSLPTDCVCVGIQTHWVNTITHTRSFLKWSTCPNEPLGSETLLCLKHV